MLTQQQSTYLNAMGIQIWRERGQAPTLPENVVAFYDKNQQLVGYVLHDELPQTRQHAAYRLLDNILFSQGWVRGEAPSDKACDDRLLVLIFGECGKQLTQQSKILPALSELLDQPLRKREVLEQL